MTELPPEIIQAIKHLQDGSRENDDSALIHGYFRRLVAKWLYQAGAPKKSIEDLIQDTFLLVFKHIETFRGDPPMFISWLKQTARRVNLDRVKKEGAKKRIQSPLSLDSDGWEEDGEGRPKEIWDTEPSPERRMIEREEIGRIM